MRLLGTFSPTQAFRGQHSLHSRNGWPSHNKCLRMIPFRTFQDFSKLDVQRNLQITASREAVQHSTGHCVVIPGFLKGAPSYSGLAESLSLLGSSVEVVPISRLDWYPTLAGAPFRRLLDKIALAVARAYERHGRVTLVCHSAGGFLARILLGPEPYSGAAYGLAAKVDTVVTLGTPHRSLEAYPFGRVPERRAGEAAASMPEAARASSLAFANHFYPRGDCFPGTRFVCVAARSVRGESYDAAALRDLALSRRPQALRAALEQAFAFSSYKANCGVGTVWGDGVTPVECALLEGSTHIVLEGPVRHNPGSLPEWYGDPEVIRRWASLACCLQAEL
mmetsp:Transcript_24527/g.58300  ORF Transcript_24527/g.58300 Transcript_24527/m.58300 type:complete len:336 (-) Transcript_24527:477-1484(-)